MKIYDLGRHKTTFKMKEWLKRFFKGTFIACQILIVTGAIFIALWLLLTAAIIVSAMVPPTTNNIIIMLCIFFVAAFGLIWSTWS